RRPLDRLQHRAAVRAGAEPVPRYADPLPLLLRAQDDVREVLGRLPHLPRRFRDARRAVRCARPDPDREALPVPGDPLRGALLARARALARGSRPAGAADLSRPPGPHPADPPPRPPPRGAPRRAPRHAEDAAPAARRSGPPPAHGRDGAMIVMTSLQVWEAECSSLQVWEAEL